jgi:hypothetical protein
VVKDALAKVAAKDIAGIGSLACAGQADKLKSELDMSSSLGASLPGVDTKGLVDSVQIDTSAVQVGTPTVSGDTAQVPLSGSMKLTFDKDKLRPIIKAEMQQSGQTLTDDQIDTLITSMGGGLSNVPVNESMQLKNENGAWKICPEDSGSSPAPS